MRPAKFVAFRFRRSAPAPFLIKSAAVLVMATCALLGPFTSSVPAWIAAFSESFSTSGACHVSVVLLNLRMKAFPLVTSSVSGPAPANV